MFSSDTQHTVMSLNALKLKNVSILQLIKCKANLILDAPMYITGTLKARKQFLFLMKDLIN